MGVAAEQVPLHRPVPRAGAEPSGWGWVRLDRACIGVFDCPHSTPILTDSGPHLVRSQDIRSGVFRAAEAARVSEVTYRDRTARAEPRHGDLFFSREGTYFGIAAEVPPDVRTCLGQRMVLLRPDPDRLNFRYVRYWLNSPAMVAHMRGFRDGSVAERLNMPTIRALPILVPALAEQNAIAAVLGALDDKIELNIRMNKALEAMARAVFKSWFVDFDPVRAKAERRQLAGLEAMTAACFPDRLENSLLGAIPAGWNCRMIREMASLDRGLSYSGRFLSTSGRPLINLGCFRGRGEFSSAHLKHYAGEFKPRHLVRPGDLLVANTDITQKREVLGSPALVPQLPGDDAYAFSHHVYAVRFRPGFEQWRVFLYFLLLQPEFRERAEGFATGTTVLALPADAVLDHMVATPDGRLLARFLAMVEPMLAAVQVNCEQSSSLSTVRDALLPKLLSGQVRVKDAEKMAETKL